MTATQPELWPEGWELEPPAEPRRVDFGALLDEACKAHAAQRRRWMDGIPAASPEQPDGPTVEPLSNFGRSAARPDNRLRARVDALAHTGSYL